MYTVVMIMDHRLINCKNYGPAPILACLRGEAEASFANSARWRQPAMSRDPGNGVGGSNRARLNFAK
jgi:hypothetical protein